MAADIPFVLFVHMAHTHIHICADLIAARFGDDFYLMCTFSVNIKAFLTNESGKK